MDGSEFENVSLTKMVDPKMIPREIWKEIFSFISFTERTPLRIVCRLFSFLILNDYWYSYALETINTACNNPCLTDSISQFGRIS